MQRNRICIRTFFPNRKVVLYINDEFGKKMQKDLEYIFDLEGIRCISVKDEISAYLQDNVIIGCGKDDNEIRKSLQIYNTFNADNYYGIEYLLNQLDISVPKLADGKKVFIWGAGGLSRFINLRKKIEEMGIRVAGYIDNDLAKKNTIYDGLMVHHPSGISSDEISKYFIVVSSAYADEIAEELSERGLNYKNNYISYMDVVANAADMMRKTLYAEPIDGPECNLPFTMANVHREGIYVCPPDWINQLPIGTSTEDLNKIWNSTIADIFRLSILNRTYSFCNLELCGLMDGEHLKINDTKGDYNAYHVPESPEMLVLSFDHTCNLWCESCRKCLSVAGGKELEYAKRIAKSVSEAQWLNCADKVLMAGDGEVFSSRTYKELLYSKEVNRESINILTNGNLLNQSTFDKIAEKYKHIAIEISIDAAYKETYERLRRGGNWDKLYKNLKMLGELRMEGRIDYLGIRMVVQQSNITEMPDFVRLGIKNHVDLVRFARIRNFGSYTEDEFENITIMDSHNSEGNIKEEFADILKNPILRDPIVGLYDMEKLVEQVGDSVEASILKSVERSKKLDNFIYL